jgi:hypothetical protein
VEMAGAQRPPGRARGQPRTTMNNFFVEAGRPAARSRSARHGSPLCAAGRLYALAVVSGVFTLGLLVFMSSCSGGSSTSTPTPEPPVPQQLIRALIAGLAPSSMGRAAESCVSTRTAEDLYTAHCGGGNVYIVSTHSASVVPGDDATKRRWESLARGPTPLSKTDLARIACETAGGRWSSYPPGGCFLP